MTMMLLNKFSFLFLQVTSASKKSIICQNVLHLIELFLVCSHPSDFLQGYFSPWIKFL